MTTPPNRWRWPFRCRGSRREEGMVQLFSLGGIEHHQTSYNYEDPNSDFNYFVSVGLE
jgi:hypothetical protein